MYGICENCENFDEAGNGEVSCELGHEMIKDREECDDYDAYTDISGEGTWSMK